MAKVHQQFIKFHDAIKLDFDSNATLREKRDIILEKLKNNIDEEAPKYTTFNQGSYALSTGVQPVDGDFDIDVGLWFEMSKDDVEPVEAKKWVYNALENHTSNVKIKTPCVTVTYVQNGEPCYHVDLTVYATNNTDEKIYLAKGKDHSNEENKFWDESNPKELMEKINGHHQDVEDRAQFRRVIRYVKRWKDLHFNDGGHSRPTGIGITIAAMNSFQPNYTITDPFANKREYDDLSALLSFISNMLGAFAMVYHNNEWAERLVVRIPSLPGNDLFEKMTNKQMSHFKEKLTKLKTSLQNAVDEVDPVEACKTLKKVLGDEFPVPTSTESAQRQRPAVATVSGSAI